MIPTGELLSWLDDCWSGVRGKEYQAIRALIENYPSYEVAFVRHIEKHLLGRSIPVCKICGKNILEIAEEE